jgi:hypothetical protein
MTRAQQLALIYRHTPRDYKGKLDGARTILTNENGATVLVKLDELTDEDIARKLPLALRDEAVRLGKEAHKKGRQCVPAHDKALLALTAAANPTGVVGHPMTLKLLHEWSRAWHAANLAS